jgi:AraC family transcriptional regulator
LGKIAKSRPVYRNSPSTSGFEETLAGVARSSVMALSVQILACGPGWRVRDVVCDQGPKDRAFAEQHTEEVAISSVTEGSFQYRTPVGTATLVPGSLLLGNAGSCFECGHEHAQGDRCLAFHFAPAFFEGIAAGVPGARRVTFTHASVPPITKLTGLLAHAEVARNRRDAAALEEIAMRLAGAVLMITAGEFAPSRTPSPRDERRITRVVRRIEAQSGGRLGLNALASEAAMSPYHFLRTFRQVTGMTPHQYVLHTRLWHAARCLRESTDSISAIASKAGFRDLATFNRRFHRLIGTTPTSYRTVG